MTQLYMKDGVYYRRKEKFTYAKAPKIAIYYFKKIIKKLVRKII